MRSAFLLYEMSWTGRISPRIVFDRVETPIDTNGPRRIGTSLELAGDALALANSDDPQRVHRIAAMFPCKE